MADSADNLNKSGDQEDAPQHLSDTAQRNSRDRDVATPHGVALTTSAIKHCSFMAKGDQGFEADDGSEDQDDCQERRSSNRLAGSEPDLVPEAPAKGKGKSKKVPKDTELREPGEPDPQ